MRDQSPFHTMGCRHRGEYLPPVC
jgi:hypothetical protein